MRVSTTTTMPSYSIPSDRTYSAPPSIHNVAAQYVYDRTLVVMGKTGNWTPMVGVSGNAGVGAFTTSTSLIANSQTTVAPGYTKANVSIISGVGFVNGTGPLPAGTNLSYGGYGSVAINSLVVSGSSTAAILLTWEG